MLQQVYEDKTMSRAWIFEWHERFKECRKDVKDDTTGTVSLQQEINIKWIRLLVHGNC